MKKIIILIVLIGATAGIAVMHGCKTTKVHKNSPEYAAEQFMKHLGLMEIQEARKYASSNTQKVLDMLEVLLEMSKEKGADTVIQKREFRMEVVSVDIDKNVAVVTFRAAERGNVQTLDMVRENKKWLVDIKKEKPNLDVLPKMEGQ
jgi:hypothetical protein